MSQTIDAVYRDFNTAGVPASGDHEPRKPEIRALLKQIQNSGGQAVTRNTLTALQAVTPPNENYMGVVLTGTGAGYYSRSGGAWVFGRPFADTFAHVDLIGSGTAQTGFLITGVSPSSVEVFFAVVSTPNTGPLTLSISGETAREVVNLAGNPLSAGEWAGVVMFFLNDLGDYQLLIDAGAAASAADSASAAAQALADLLERYLGAYASDADATEAAGTPVEGQLYFNITDGVFRVYHTGAWQDQSSGVTDGSVTAAKLAAAIYADKPTAEGGTNNVNLMTPLRTLQQGKALGQLINVRSYGAALNGVTDDTAAFQASLADQGAVIVPYTPSGFIAGGLTLGSGQVIIAERKTRWKVPAAASYGVRVTAFGISNDAILENFWFDLGDCPTSTTAIRFGTADGNVYKFRARSCGFWNCGEAIGDEAHATNFSFDVAFEDCICVYTRGRQVNLRRTRGYTRLQDFKVDHTQNTGQVTWEGIRLEDFIGANLLRVEVVGPVLPTWTFQAGATGLVLEGKGNGKATLWLRDVLVDNTRGPGIYVKDVFNLDAESIMGYQNLGAQIALWNITKSNLVNVATVGAKGLTNAPAGTPNIYMNGCSNVSGANVRADDATGNGIVLENCNDNNITNLRASGCGARGYVETGTSNRNVVLNARYSGNTDGNLIQSGAQSAHVAWIGNGGTFLASTAGAATT